MTVPPSWKTGCSRPSVSRLESGRGPWSSLTVTGSPFLCGTGTQINFVTKIDNRQIGNGALGPVTERIRRIYFDAVHGKSARYRSWLTPVYTGTRA